MSNHLEKVTAFITRERNSQTELLLFRHPSAGIQIPAGTVELEEHHADAAVREAKEETGLTDFNIKKYIGNMEMNVDQNQFMINHNSKIHSRPDISSTAWTEIRRGIKVFTTGRSENGFIQIEYKEYDQYETPQYVSYYIMGWAPKDNLTRKVIRHMYHLTTDDQTKENWIQYSDHHYFELFWAPLMQLPDIVPSQQIWLDYIHHDLHYSLTNT